MASASLVVWLGRLGPLFLVIALASLGYSHWMMWMRGRQGRPITRAAAATVWLSTAVNAAIMAAWVLHVLRQH